MGFSMEWEDIYKKKQQLSVWPWSHLISLVHRYGNLRKGMKILELGCGAGANIPFFVKEGADYYAIEGSGEMVAQLQEKFKNELVHIVRGDFTQKIPWKESFDIIIDRGALTHNSTRGIKSAIALIQERLTSNGKMIGTDWFSFKYDVLEKDLCNRIDTNTFAFSSGYFAGWGNCHFSDEKHLRELFRDFSFEYLAERCVCEVLPESRISAYWDFVVKKDE